MRYLYILLTYLVVSFGHTANAQTWVSDFDPGELGGPETVGAYWENGQAFYISLRCGTTAPGLQIMASFGEIAPWDIERETVFIRISGLDYLLPWRRTTGLGSARNHAIVFPDSTAAATQKWAGQDGLLSAIDAGHAIQILASGRPDRTDARELNNIPPDPGGSAIRVLLNTCGPAAAAPPSPAPDPEGDGFIGGGYWELVPDTPFWGGATAKGLDYFGRVNVWLACGADGQVVMAGKSPDYPNPVGQASLTVTVDGVVHNVLWHGWNDKVISNPTGTLVQALRTGQRAYFQDAGGEQITFPLAGARAAIETALASCSGSPSVPPASSGDMLTRLKAKVAHDIETECRAGGASGARLEAGAFQETLRMTNPNPDIVVDFSFVSCIGGIGYGAGQCGAVKCLHRRYLPGETDYFLNDEYLQ